MNIETPEARALLEELEFLTNEFKRLLVVETKVMETRSSDALPGLNVEKSLVVEQLQANEATLISFFSEFPDDNSVKRLKEMLAECQQLNRQNQTIALVELKHTQNSLELLRSLLMLDDLPLYSSEGLIKVKREKRNFGSA